jgi:26S proteasome regulatory subunit N5
MSTARREELEALFKAVQTKADDATDLDAAVGMLLPVEKKCRLAAEAFLTRDVAVHILNLCWKARNLDALNQNVLLLCKRRAQLTQVITGVVQRGAELVDELEARDERMQLISTLRTVSEGKIYVEVERARLTREYVAVLESEGKLDEASSTLQEVQVETYGAMDKREKVEYILEQMRLVLMQKDFIRLGIIANKINKKNIADEDMQDLKLRYYDLMTALHTQQEDVWALCLDHQAIYFTPMVQEDEEMRQAALASYVLLLVLSPYGPHVDDAMHRVLATEGTIHDMPAYKALLEVFTTQEIAPQPLPFADDLKSHPLFTGEAADSPLCDGTALPPVRPGDVAWGDKMDSQVIRHDIRVVSKYYTQIDTPRLCELLGQTPETVETHLSEMVTGGDVYARIDRPAGVVNFSRPKPEAETLSEWAADISSCLGLIEKTTHLINKEVMVHKAAAAKR